MKYFLALFFLTSFYSFSQNVDSVLHNGKWYKLYPYEQLAEVKRKSTTSRYGWRNKYLLRDKGLIFDASSVNSDVFQPLQELPDGDYIQIVALDLFELEHPMHSRSRKASKPIKLKSLNTVRDTLAIYSVFSIVDSKLEGDVRFLSPDGDTLIYGQYKNNLREGKWIFGDHKNITREFKDGLKHGLSTLVESKKDGQTLESIVYERGVKKSQSIQNINKSNTTRNETYYDVDGTPDLNLEKFFENGVLEREGKIIKRKKVGTWKYYGEAGELTGKEEYWEEEVLLTSGFLAWHRGLPHAMRGLDVPYMGIFALSGYKYGQLWNGRPGISSGSRNISCYGNAEYWHPKTKEKWFTYTVSDSGEFIPGVLYYSNGKPRYKFEKDSVFEVYVRTYYDINGVETHQTREPWEAPTKKYATKVLRYNGQNLYFKRNDRQGDHYAKKRLRKQEKIDSTYEENDRLDAVIRHTGGQLVTHTYYIPKKRIKVHEEYFEEAKKHGYNYKLEIRQLFNENYTQAKTRVTLTYKDGFQVVQTFDVKYSRNQYEYHRSVLSNEKDPSGLAHSGYYSSPGYYKTPDGFFFGCSDIRSFDWFKNRMGQVSNMKTVYTFERKPLNGTVVIDKDSYANFKEKGKGKYKMTLDYDQGSYYHKFRDAFGLNSYFDRYDMLPDFLEEIKLPTGCYFTHAKIQKIEGGFKDGQLDGPWKAYNSKGRVIFEGNYEKGKLKGTCNIYFWKKKRKYKKGKYQVSKGEKRKVVVPERHFVNVQLEFGANGIESYKEIGLNGGIIAKGTYKDGKCVYYEKGYEHYPIMNIDAYLSNNLSINNYEPPSAEDHNAVERFYYNQDGVLEKIENERPIDKNDKELMTFTLDQGALHGPFEIPNAKGEFDHGIFTGTITQHMKNNKVLTQHLAHGLLIKEELHNEDYKLSEIVYDTSLVKMPGNVARLYTFCPKVPNRELRDDYLSSDTVKTGHLTTFYADGTRRAEGIYSSFGRLKTGIWKYYTPEGKLKNELLYERGKFEVVGSDSMEYVATLTEYVDDKPVYEAYVTDIISKYNCNSANNYETRQLVLKEDKLEKVTFPTKSFKIYYETGVLQAEGELVDGIPQGLWKFYNPEGGLKATGLYKDGQRDGRWLSGDLTNVGFIGDFCLNPLAYKFDPNYESEMKKNLNVSIVVYSAGEQISISSISAYLNNR